MGCLPCGISVQALALVPAGARLPCAHRDRGDRRRQERGRGKEAPRRAAGAEHSRVGASCPGVPRGSRPTTGTFSRFLEAAPAPAEPCGFPPAAASQPPLPNVLGERSQVRQSGDKSELSLAALGLCSGLIGGSGSPPAPLRPPRAGAPGLAAWAGLAPRGKLPTCFQHEEGACVFELRRNLL